MANWRVDFDSSDSSVKYGQSLLSSVKRQRRKREKKAKIAKYTALGLGIGDMILQKKATRQIDFLEEEEQYDLNKRKSDWGDKVSFEKLYDTIDQSGYDASDEESYRNYFYDLAIKDYGSANVDKQIHRNKDTWVDVKMNNYVKDWKKDLKNWKPWLRADIEEFQEPVKEYYKQQIRNVLRPGNTSTVRKVLQKFGLWEDEDIKMTFEAGKYAGALRNTKSVDEAYTLAMANTHSRLEVLRGDVQGDEQYEDLPALMRWIKFSKTVNRNLQQQVADAFLVDKGMFYGQNLLMNPENLPSGVSQNSSLGKRILRSQEVIGRAPTDDNQATGNIFHDTFYNFATRPAQGHEDYDPEKPGLGWTSDEWDDWFNSKGSKASFFSRKKGAPNFQDLLFHRFTGPEATLKLRDHFAEQFGGQWETDGASHMFMMVWARRAQNLFDISKERVNLKLTEGANPADWSTYIEQAFRETIQNDLILRDDGRLEVVETGPPGAELPERLGPKPFVEEEEETIVAQGAESPGPVPGPGPGVPGQGPVPEVPEQDEELTLRIAAIREHSVITKNDMELKGPAAIIYDELNLGTSTDVVEERIIELTEYFPDEKSSMDAVLIDFMKDMLSTIPTASATEDKDWSDPYTARESIAEKGELPSQVIPKVIGAAWRGRLDTERRARLTKRLEGSKAVSDRQFEKDLKNAGLSANASTREIQEYLGLEEEEDESIMAAQ